MEEVLEFLQKCKTYYLATVENVDGVVQARVRPFGTADIFEGCLNIQTGKVKEVSKQIHANPKVELCAFDGEQWLRLAATAVENPSLDAQEHMLETHPSLKRMYKVGDGNTELFKLIDATATFSSFTAAPRVVKW